MVCTGSLSETLFITLFFPRINNVTIVAKSFVIMLESGLTYALFRPEKALEVG